ncbi:MAG: hypothetical protein K6F61_04190 [Clostridiales bacterium]|nr:hypothetical protein [Clostridiales bacterium]
MRKVTGLVLIALLLLVCAFALAENAGTGSAAAESPEQALPADLFEVWDDDGESAAWLANAVPVSDGILIAPLSVRDVPLGRLAVSDGQYAWDAVAVIPDELNRFALVFYDTDSVHSRRGTWQMLPWGESRPAYDLTVLFGDRMGSRVIRGVTEAEEIMNRGQRCYLLTLTDPAPAGSPVLTSDGLLAGIVVAQWAEGGNRVVALPAEGIAASVTGVAGLLITLPAWSEPPKGLAVTAEKNLVTVDWSGMELPEKKDGEQVYIVVLDTGNEYLTWFPAEIMERKTAMLLTPGRFYIVGPVVTAGIPDAAPSAYASVYIPNAGKVTDYSFTPVLTAIAEMPEGGLKEGELPVPVTEVTEALLRSGRACFYSHSSYEVTETKPQLSLLVTLTDPAGNNYRYESSWVYGPEYMEADIWYIPLKDMGLTEGLDANGYPKGVYEVAYYIEGELADSFTFELK